MLTVTMKQLTFILIACVCFAIGYFLGRSSSTKPQTPDMQELNFVLHHQQANYKLAALVNIKAGDHDRASGILEASLIVDEGEMASCGKRNSRCASQVKSAYQDYLTKKEAYENNAITP